MQQVLKRLWGKIARPEHTSNSIRYWPGHWQKLSLVIWLIAIALLPFSDLEIISYDPWTELHRMLQGLLAPDFTATEYLFAAILQTVNFAVLGVAFGLVLGAPLALIYTHPVISTLCSLTRAVHELFWALLFLQVFGLSPLTGILALTLPFGATFARVFSDILRQSSDAPLTSTPRNSDRCSRYLYAKIALVMPQLLSYVRYRFECALRSSAVLGFIGMPTIGFYLETAFRQGNYHEGMALLMLFIAMIGGIRYWCRPRLIPVYLGLAFFTLAEIPSLDAGLIVRFLTQDVVPPAIAAASSLLAVDLGSLGAWFSEIVVEQAIPGAQVTIVLAMLALALTHLLALTGHGIASRQLLPKPFAYLGQFVLLIGRSVPEYVMAYAFLILLGPSMLPAILALAIHNGAVVAYLAVRQSDKLAASQVNFGRCNQFHYRVLPSVYPNLMALLFYRFEIIVRETAVFGMLGIMALGFYIDSNFAEIRYSDAIVLIGITACFNVVIDKVSRRYLSSSNQAQHCG
ncbi:PhnE/PtxC family ABC transporter permease [Paraferrimonas sedimenticola]|uniref:Phosphonate ABC transporter, permease protein PhnE n=1 Tax=Paraferrimonas sedimenticola TaxID=375674 RepID=A0AA37RY65_9GAMM|nr:ABC transporter permease [Paraferrimonas sedimenticola]GLP97328.1 phosphonate ABC transporter, permease protein PhnE [Paraferrimonas sedimenticola]